MSAVQEVTAAEKAYKKALKKVQATLKQMAKITGNVITTGQVNRRKLHKAMRIRTVMDSHFTQAKALEKEYIKLRDEIGAELPGELNDTVELVIDGIIVKKHARNKAAGKLDEAKVFALAQSKGLVSQITKLVPAINEEGLLAALLEGKITYEEYQACTIQDIVPVVSIQYVDDVLDEEEA